MPRSCDSSRRRSAAHCRIPARGGVRVFLGEARLRQHWFRSCRWTPLVWLSAACWACGGGGGGPPPFTMTNAIVVADLNGDGAVDLAAAQSYFAGPAPHQGHVSVLLADNGNRGRFLPARDYPVGADPLALAAGDFNTDGVPDLVATSAPCEFVAGRCDVPEGLSLLIQDSEHRGEFQPAAQLPTQARPVHVSVGDLNGDGLADIAVADAMLSLLIQEQAPPATFGTVTVGMRCDSVALGDLNADGASDIVCAGSDLVRVAFQARASGGFLWPIELVAGAQPLFAAIADLNGDALPDIIVANYGSPDGAVHSTLSILLQEPAGGGVFLPHHDYPTNTPRAIEVVVADLNGDGRPDVVVANSGSLAEAGSLAVFLQSPAGSGALLPATTYTIAAVVTAVAVGDLNGDGRLDLVAGGSDGVEVLFQTQGTPGAFAAPVRVH